ncbi:MAG: hypothetical protein PVH59_04555 [Anaerolineae bacterium]
MEDALSVVIGLVVSVLVSALVWTTVAAGLYQLVRERLHEVAVVSQDATRKRYLHRSEKGPQIPQQQPMAGN